jgi:hypothetical protein
LTFTLVLKISLLIGLSIILYQDVKERAVWWFLFPFFGAIAGYLHFRESFVDLFFLNILLNIAAIVILFLLSFVYVQLKMKVSFFKEAIGLGDILFFLGLTMAFPTQAFIVILVFSMIFSLGLHKAFSGKQKDPTVPLAGYASLFLIFVYLANWTGLYHNLYLIG